MDAAKTTAKSRDASGRSVDGVASQAYRDAMSRFAGAVHVVTTGGPAGRRGVTVSAAVSVSDDPPTLLICLNRNRPENAMFADNGCFALNVLSAEHLALARAFAGEGSLAMDKRFELGDWQELETGAPVLAGARISLDCKVVETRQVHTHDVLLGEVVGVGEPVEGEALIYLDRQYATV